MITILKDTHEPSKGVRKTEVHFSQHQMIRRRVEEPNSLSWQYKEGDRWLGVPSHVHEYCERTYQEHKDG